MLTQQLDLVPDPSKPVPRTWWYESDGAHYLFAPGGVVHGRILPRSKVAMLGEKQPPWRAQLTTEPMEGQPGHLAFYWDPPSTPHPTLELAKAWLERKMGVG